MTIDQSGIEFITQWEGFRAASYLDVAGHSSIGIGHLILPHESFPGPITLAQAQQLLWSDLAGPEAAVNALAPECNQNQFNALCSFAFNLGVGSLKTMLGHGFDQAPTQIPLWCHAGGKVVEGLQKRRAAEAALFSQPIAA